MAVSQTSSAIINSGISLHYPCLWLEITKESFENLESLKYIYTKFYALARQYVGVFANSVSADSLFSKVENTITKKNRLDSILIKVTIFKWISIKM